jgi:drug/metabolite transporter superfamily protein YnfA
MIGGLSMSRTAIVGALVLAMTGRKYALFAGILISVSVMTTLLINPERLSIPWLERSADLRIATIDGTSTETPPSSFPAIEQIDPIPVLHIQGYGFGNYSFHTGRIQPHNIFVRTWYELGTLSIPLVGFLLTLWWRGGRDWRFLSVAIVTGMLTDELLGSVAGVYMILGYAIMRKYRMLEIANQPVRRIIYGNCHETG